MNEEEGEYKRLYGGVQRTLSVGMAISFGLMGLGMLAVLLSPGADVGRIVPLHELPAALLHFDPAALLALGVLVLMFIPVVHLYVARASFVRTGDRRMAACAALILLLLLIGAALSILRSL